MGTITSVEPITVPAYIAAGMIGGGIARRLFSFAMHPAALLDRDDTCYEAWWTVRQTLDRISNARRLDLPIDALRPFFLAIRAGHEKSHAGESTVYDHRHCQCELAKEICKLFDLFEAESVTG